MCNFCGNKSTGKEKKLNWNKVFLYPIEIKFILIQTSLFQSRCWYNPQGNNTSKITKEQSKRNKKTRTVVLFYLIKKMTSMEN